MTNIRPKVVEAHTEAQAAEQQKAVHGQRKRGKVGSVWSGAQDESDTVDVSLGREINNELGADRQQRIAELKAMVQSGNYKPDSKAVAGAFVNFIDDEVGFEKMLVGAKPAKAEV